MGPQLCGDGGCDEGVGPVDQQPGEEQERDVAVVAGVVHLPVQGTLFSVVLVGKELKGVTGSIREQLIYLNQLVFCS